CAALPLRSSRTGSLSASGTPSFVSEDRRRGRSRRCCAAAQPRR
ncbi:MAG: hypothetical protein AVDCRST_MAG42-607, partial [uncultured Chthoniobacterales bacterium]